MSWLKSIGVLFGIVGVTVMIGVDLRTGFSAAILGKVITSSAI